MPSKGDCQSEYRKLKVKIQNFPFDIMKILPFTKTTTLKNEVQLILQQQEKQDFEQERERHEIFAQIQNLRKDITKLKDYVKNSKKNDLQKIQSFSENLSQKVSIFKEKQMLVFESMQDQAEILYNDLMIFQENSQKYDSLQIQIDHIQEEEDEIDQVSDDDPQGAFEEHQLNKRLNKCKFEIEKIDQQLKQNGGKNCAWQGEDHADFLKLKTKYRGDLKDYAFLTICVTKFPTFSEDQVEDHIQRFLKQQRWENQKKEIMELYKTLKSEKDQQDVDKLNADQNKIDNKQKEKEMQKKLKEQQLKEQQVMELKEWKLKKQIEKVCENRPPSNNIRKISINKVNEEEKAKLLDYKKTKELQKQLQKEREIYEKSQKKVISEEEQQRIKEKQQNLLEKNKRLLTQKQQKIIEQQDRKNYLLTKQNDKFQNVESKLNELTLAAKDKYRNKFDPTIDKGRGADTFGGNLIHLVRAVPNWRQNA